MSISFGILLYYSILFSSVRENVANVKIFVVNVNFCIKKEGFNPISLSLKQQTTNPPIEKWSEGKLLKKRHSKADDKKYRLKNLTRTENYATL